MTATLVGQVRPGATITTYKSRGLFKGSDTEQRIVVGNERAGRVPVGISDQTGGRALYYAAVRQGAIEEILTAKGTRLGEKQLTIEESNIATLWSSNLIWNEEQSGLKNDVTVWVTFDNNEKIVDISETRPPDLSPVIGFNGNGTHASEVKFSPLKLSVKDNHLGMELNPKIPHTIHYQLEILNWLVMQSGENKKS